MTDETTSSCADRLRQLIVAFGIATGVLLTGAQLLLLCFGAPSGNSDPAGNGMASGLFAMMLFAFTPFQAVAFGAAWGALKPSWWGLGIVELLASATLLTGPALWFVVQTMLVSDPYATYYLPEGALLLWPVGATLAAAFTTRSVFAGRPRIFLAPLPLLLLPLHPLAFLWPDLH